MPFFPKITGPCPYADRLDEILEGDICRLCQRQVTDLTDMTDAERRRFMASCSGAVCVSYRLPAVAMAAAVAVAAAAPAYADQPARAPEQQAVETVEVVVVAGRVASPQEHLAVGITVSNGLEVATNPTVEPGDLVTPGSTWAARSFGGLPPIPGQQRQG